jgi:tetrahydromethanopterin S-methyltransferase subunit G
MKNAIDFEAKLVEYGTVLREYDEVEALCIADDWKSRKLINRLEEIERRRDNVVGPLNTLMKKLAKEIA